MGALRASPNRLRWRGGGGGGLRITAPTSTPSSPPINEGAPVAPHPDIPAFAQARPARAAPVVILDEGDNTFPDLYYRVDPYTYRDGTVSNSPRVDVDISDVTLRADGSIVLPRINIEVDDWILTWDESNAPLPDGGSVSGSIAVEIDDYRAYGNGLTTYNPSEIIDYLRGVVDDDDDDGVATSLTSTWDVFLHFRDTNGNFLGTIDSENFVVDGIPQSDGSIDVTLEFYVDADENIHFQEGTGRTFIDSVTYTFNSGDPDADAPDVSFLGILADDGGYEVPAILANRAEDGFGNAHIDLTRRGGDSAQLRIDADGVTGDVYREGHQWYKDGVAIGRDEYTLTITEAGTYRADVAIDLNRDGHADIWVETAEMRVLSNFRTVETINSGAPTTNSRIPTIQEHSASTAASVVVLAEGANAIPDTFYYRAEPYTWDDGTFSNSAISDVRIPSITLHADGSVTLPTINLMIDGWTLTSDIFNGRFEVEINDYEVQYDGITISDAHDTFDDSEASSRIISLSSIWTLSGNLNIYDDNGDILGAINPGTFTIDGIPQSDGSIDITLDIYRAANGNIQFGSGQTLLSSETLTIDLNDPDDDDDGPEVSFLGVRKGNGYEIPTIITNLARDGFGNARVVAADGTADSPEELLRIEADGVSGNVYEHSHRWYKDGVIQGNTMHTHQTDGAGRYHADVAIDVDLDGHADIWVETLAIDIA